MARRLEVGPVVAAPIAFDSEDLARTGAWAPPAQFAEYRLLRRLGEGGMGQVWIALDTDLDRKVAVKFLSGELERAPGAHERFLVEARAAARLQHPNVVTVHRIGALGHRPYIVSELIDGTPLSRIERPLPSARVIELGVGLARGLAAAHRHGVLHRDLKPANAILADDGQVKLLDFGLAKLTERPRGVLDVAVVAPPRAAAAMVAATMPLGARAVDATAPLPLPATMPSATPAPQRAVIARAAADDDGGPRPSSEPAGALTGLGVVMGTPYYMAPETWAGEPATPATDVYALGVVLYELTAGRPPHADVPVAALAAVVITTDATPLATEVPGVDPRLAAIVDRCLQRAPGARYPGGEDVLLALEAARPGDPARAPVGNPYRGLYRFEADHRAVFFGRAAELRALVERVRHDGLVVVAGDSGVGKSSLCRAGVLPTLLDEGIGDGRAWTVVRLVPGPRPLTALRAALELPAATTPDSTVALGPAAPRPTHEQLVRQVVAARRGRGLVVFVDQLEELVTLAEPDEAEGASRLLAELGGGVPGVRVLATARCDFLTRLSALPGLGAAIARGLYLLRPLAVDALREAVLGPARATGVAFDPPALVDELVADADAAEGGLPLLQFTLGELWQAHDRERRAITRAVVERVGGIRGALTRHADGVIGALLPAARAQARAVLLRLVSGRATRARRTEAELTRGAPAARAALDALVAGRLVAAQAGEPEAVFEVAHEALLSEWRTLRDWLDERADRRAAIARIEAATQEWLRLERARDALWGERALRDADDVPADELAGPAREFLAASGRELSRRRWRRRAGVMALLAAAVVGYLSFQAVERQARAGKVARYVDAGLAELIAARAGAAEVERARDAALAVFDRGDRAGGEAQWAALAPRVVGVTAGYRAASQAFEAAVIVDHGAARARALLADTLLERARLAERERNDSERDEALARLRLYDDGRRLAAWAAPASLAVTTAPLGAAVRIAAVEVVDGRYRLGGWRELGPAPVTALALPAGSYVLELALVDHAPTRYPVLLARGEAFTADVPLIASARVPADMVYVPPGRFQFGSTASDRLRVDYLRSPPAHARTTAGFLIARHEATVDQWLRFVDALPAAEARLRLPAAGHDGAAGFVGFRRAARGWTMTLQPASERYQLEVGQPLRYRHRATDVVQASARLPVTAVAPADIEAFVGWLDRTGQVPGARLCTELEWERAARGADLRTYAHGDVLRPDDANYGESGSDFDGYGPDAVGSHPASRSVFGVDDQVGNVWEFTTSALPETRYVLRGGGYPLDDTPAMAVNREEIHDALRDASIGFRVCADATPAR